MSDLIERQAAIEAVRNCKILDVKNLLIDKAEAMTNLMMLPPAQSEIVRCKDCKHRPVDGEDMQGFDVEFPDWTCPCRCDDGWYNWRPNDEWFCGAAERRTDG